MPATKTAAPLLSTYSIPALRRVMARGFASHRAYCGGDLCNLTAATLELRGAKACLLELQTRNPEHTEFYQGEAERLYRAA